MGVPQAMLQPLAERCVDSADRQGRTPLIAIERGLRLAPEFYAALASELRRAAGRPLRFEVLVDLERAYSPWRVGTAKRRAEAIRGAVQPILGDSAAVETRTVLSRPAGAQRPLVVGLGAADDAVPGWAAVLRLTCRPTATDDFQLIPAAA